MLLEYESLGNMCIGEYITSGCITFCSLECNCLAFEDWCSMETGPGATGRHAFPSVILHTLLSSFSSFFISHAET